MILTKHTLTIPNNMKYTLFINEHTTRIGYCKLGDKFYGIYFSNNDVVSDYHLFNNNLSVLIECENNLDYYKECMEFHKCDQCLFSIYFKSLELISNTFK